MVRFMYYTENQYQVNFECVPPADVTSVNNSPFNCPLSLEVQKQRVKFYIVCVLNKPKDRPQSLKEIELNISDTNIPLFGGLMLTYHSCK